MPDTPHRLGFCVDTRNWTAALWVTAALLAAAPARAQDALPPVSIGAGVQASFVHDGPTGGGSSDRFVLNSVRLYASGSAAKDVKVMFNTEYDGGTNHVTVLDAAAKFEFSEKANLWVGRFLPPSDRANLYGPYYSHDWAVYTDGVQDGYPFLATGRDNGLMYWGQFGMAKLAGGVFDGPTTTGNPKVLAAGRIQVDLWDPEGGYYLNGTYYGDKNLLAVGAAGQVQDGKKASNADFLLEKKVSGGAFSLEAEYAKYNQLGGYNSRYGVDQGGYVLVSYLFPPATGMTGRFEILGKFAKADFSRGLTALDPDFNQKTTEINVNYILNQFKSRVMFFYLQKNFSNVFSNDKQVGVGFQVQM